MYKFKDIALIQTTNLLHPVLGIKTKIYYKVVRSENMLCVVTSHTTATKGLGTSCIRTIKNKRVCSMKLDDLKSRLACTEIARQITDMYEKARYAEKQVLRSMILADARYLAYPYKCSYVHNGGIFSGTIQSVIYNIDEDTNEFLILPDGKQDPVRKFQGEIHIPHTAWRKLGE